MKMGNYRRLMDKDFKPDYKDLVSQLAVSLNQAIEDIYLALNRRITFSENIQSTIRDVDVRVSANGVPTSKTIFNLDSQAKVIGVIVIRCDNLTNSASYLSSSPFITWDQTQDGIQINHITGLNSGDSYKIRVITIV